MAYQVLARKWRPQRFCEVVGQEHISRTLKNAIVQNRIGHAYLFVGSRGIGKTTTARIFAKALNCPNNKDGEPCCECESCREVMNGSSMDVIEIDGASHNKVEDVRDIRENVQYAPTRGRYKIYIIDEVHMLTTQAWNALLKTLEEPPPHVKFLFATTEPHKVLPTIISRCQRFDLKRLSVPLIMSRLRQIADGEKINIEDTALAAIARAADGGMRDAQSIFDQIIAFCGGTEANELIREQDVIDVFGLASGMELREIASTIFTNDLNGALKILQKLADAGRDLERLYADLIEYVRKIMVAGLCTNANDILEASETELTDLTNIGKAIDPQMVQRALQQLIAQEWTFRSALNKRIYFEATLAKVMLEVHSVQLDDIFTHLNQISGTIPKGTIPQRPQIVIPPPVIQVAAPPNPKQPVPSTASEQATTQTTPAAEKQEKTATTTQPPSSPAPATSTAEESHPAPVAPACSVPASPAAETTSPTSAAETCSVPAASAAGGPTPAAPQPVTAQPTAQAEGEATPTAAQPTAQAKGEATPTAAQPTAQAVVPSSPKPAAQAEGEATPTAAQPTAQAAVLSSPVPAAQAAAPVCSVPAAQAAAPVCSVPAAQAAGDSSSEEDEAQESLGSSASLNDLLMQASSTSIDIEDEADPALASTSNSFMDAYTPQSIHGRLVEALADMSDDTRASDIIGQMQPQGFGQYGLSLTCDKSQFAAQDIEYLESPATERLINNAYRSLRLSGKVKINYINGAQEEGNRVKYRPASILEMQRMQQENPFIEIANKILSTKMTEGHIPEK